MEYQYNYYKPEGDNNDNDYEKKPGKEKKQSSLSKKLASAAAIAVVFGLVSSIVFTGTGYLMNKALGGSNSSQVESTTEAKSDSKTITNAQLTTSTSTVSSDVSEIAAATLPSIVSITNMSIQQVQSFFGGYTQQESTSAGSGIIVSQNDTELLIVTNNHVVEGSNTLTVTFNDGSNAEAQIKGTNSSRDLAVIAVPLENITSDTKSAIKIATLGDSDKLTVGEPAIAIGNALGYGQSVTLGIVSATGRVIEGYDGAYIQTDAAINPGNSGGALLNANGEVIGINSAKINSSAVEGMGFAIPISDASSIIENLMNRETRTKVDESERGLIGIRGYDVTEQSAKMYNMPTGVYIAEIISGGGAEKAGISKGCIITAVDGSDVDKMSTLQGILEYYKAGETVKVTIQVPDSSGNYTEKEVDVTLVKNSN